MSSLRETDVLVVGAGPVGQLTALRLASSGVDVTILDKHWRTGAHSYALALHSATLRLLDVARLARRTRIRSSLPATDQSLKKLLAQIGLR